MGHWDMSNRDYAEMMVLQRVLGRLAVQKGQQVSADELLQFIENSVEELTRELNRKHPERV